MRFWSKISRMFLSMFLGLIILRLKKCVFYTNHYWFPFKRCKKNSISYNQLLRQNSPYLLNNPCNSLYLTEDKTSAFTFSVTILYTRLGISTDFRNVHNVTVIKIGNGYGNPSSNPGWEHSWLQRDKTLPPHNNVLDMTINNIIVRFQ